MNIRECTPEEIFSAPGYAECYAEYTDECANSRIGETKPDIERYRKMHELGVLVCGGAFDGDALVGVVWVMVTPVAHYCGQRIATTESLFLRKKYREGLAGIRLIKWARARAGELGCPVLYISAPAGSSLDAIGARLWKRTNVVYCVETK